MLLHFNCCCCSSRTNERDKQPYSNNKSSFLQTTCEVITSCYGLLVLFAVGNVNKTKFISYFHKQKQIVHSRLYQRDEHDQVRVVSDVWSSSCSTLMVCGLCCILNSFHPPSPLLQIKGLLLEAPASPTEVCVPQSDEAEWTSCCVSRIAASNWMWTECETQEQQPAFIIKPAVRILSDIMR